LIPEADIEKAVSYLRESAKDAAQARAQMKYLTEFLKAKRAKLKTGLGAGVSNAAAEDMALAHPEYLELLEGYRTAVEQDAFHGFKREAAVAMIDAWRTQQSNLRAEGKAYG
jgi:predicted outer membrane protein